MLRVPKPPCQRGSILTPETDLEDWLIGVSIDGRDGTNWFCPFFVSGVSVLSGLGLPMLTYGLYAALRLPKAPRQEDSILSPEPDFED